MKKFSKVAKLVVIASALWGFLKFTSTLVSVPQMSHIAAVCVTWVQATLPPEQLRLSAVAVIAVSALVLGHQLRGVREDGRMAALACLGLAGGIALVAVGQGDDLNHRSKGPAVGLGEAQVVSVPGRQQPKSRSVSSQPRTTESAAGNVATESPSGEGEVAGVKAESSPSPATWTPPSSSPSCGCSSGVEYTESSRVEEESSGVEEEWEPEWEEDEFEEWGSEEEEW